MNKLLSFLNKYANLQAAFIVTAFLFLIVIPINNRLTDSLYQLAHGVSKLDYHKTYDVALVSQLFDAYGEQGRAIFAWDLIVDTFYPLAVAGAAMFFALAVVRKPILQKLLIALPMIFLVTDVLENALFVLFIATYPSLSPILVGTANLFTRIKLFTIYPTFYEMFIFMPIAIIIAVISFTRRMWAVRKAAVQNH
jgi:hypothetical protein